MTDDLQQARVEVAAKAIEKIPHIVWNSPTRQDAMTLARAALAAADAHLPTVEQIAEVLSAQTTCDGEPWPSELHCRQARAVRALFGEVAGDE